MFGYHAAYVRYNSFQCDCVSRVNHRELLLITRITYTFEKKIVTVIRGKLNIVITVQLYFGDHKLIDTFSEWI